MGRAQDFAAIAVCFVAVLGLTGCDVKNAVLGNVGQGGCVKVCEGTNNTAVKCEGFCTCVLKERDCLATNGTVSWRKECLETCEQEKDMKPMLAFEDFEAALAKGSLDNLPNLDHFTNMHNVEGMNQVESLRALGIPASMHSMVIGSVFASAFMATMGVLLGIKTFLRSGARQSGEAEDELLGEDATGLAEAGLAEE